MLIILFIFIGFLLLISIACEKETPVLVFSVGLIIIVIAGIVMMDNVQNAKVAEKKIAVYEKENKEIEKKIETSVKNYMDFEKDIYKDLKNESYINIVNQYPELKSDKLIKKQLSIYQENKETITYLKIDKIDAKKSKWWLYFGG